MNIEALRAGINCRIEVTFPGTAEQCFLHLLSDKEEQQAEFAAEQVFSGTSVALHNLDSYNAEKAVQKLFLALRDADGKRLFASADELKSVTTRDQQLVLLEAWSEHVDNNNPSPQKMTDAEFSALVDRVKKKPRETIGAISSTSTLRELVTYLVWEHTNAPTDSGSTSSPSKSSAANG